jgi:hypothetical protein
MKKFRIIRQENEIIVKSKIFLAQASGGTIC